MTLSVKFDEQDTNLKASFDETFIVGKGDNDLQVDQDVIEESTNAVSGGAVKKYVDDVISQIPKPDDIEIDTTLSVEGAVADAKATGDALKSKTTIEHYVVDIQTLKSNGLMADSVAWVDLGNSSNKLIVTLTFAAAFIENGAQHKIIDAPFEFIDVGGALVWSNQNKFKNVGISSPVITQALGLSGIVWFDTIINMMNEMRFLRENTTFEFNDVVINESIGTLAIVLTGITQDYNSLHTLRALWNNILDNPDTKLVFEYQNQENIPTYEAPYLFDTAPTVDFEEV